MKMNPTTTATSRGHKEPINVPASVTRSVTAVVASAGTAAIAWPAPREITPTRAIFSLLNILVFLFR
ncbi:MAG: hypothetical protein [Inoviridae sp.]|nr:MAG: hypothetical protein [Inoviridae sp.]